MRKKTFILGVGAHKAGTSFLYRALEEHPDVKMSYPKEMHVFDAHFLPEICGQFHYRRRDTLIHRLKNEPHQASKRWQSNTSQIMRHVNMNYDFSEYLSYYKGVSEGFQMTGDITPSYQMLQKNHFDVIQDLLSSEFTVKVIFLMRDPIERIFSAMRMDDRNLKRNDNLAHERFTSTYNIDKHRLRTQYEKTIEALDSSFSEENIFYEFYENLFNPDTFDRLEKFLGIRGLTPDFDAKVNASPTRGRLSGSSVAPARAFYAETYDFCRERFGSGVIDQFWRYA